ncbi:histone cell cycle regulator-like protein isoform X2 [Brevipalpus obovatus]|uniref:histone cell cycle regulator-like protein isoform X2 n=1 Tax=Brevipalpus obovatus TaxID=246614 RepID=UPI003D9F2E5B
MKLLKPSWVNHDGQPIFSIDIHPDGSRFATGGQGGDAGRVIIWNMGPVRDEDQEHKEKYPKMLCQMDTHTACVNVVRWSYSGKYLASAGDDHVIMIWQISSYSSSSSLTGTTNVEQWRCVNILRGHTGDILDLNWSPQDDFIASGSVDAKVIIWNAKKFPEISTTLSGHDGFVKGVAWDPIGKYIASQSDDKSIKVWRTRDWREEISICEPFVECGGTTTVLRLNWSPDGQFLVSAHAMNNRGSTAQIIEREGWKTTKDFVGHRKAVTCVRFNPHIFKEKQNHFSCIAIGSRDRSLSIWCTKNMRPSVVIHDLFDDSVLDISWSRDGYSLMTCSRDGTVTFLLFESTEIGVQISEEVRLAYLRKLYGKSLQSPSSNKETLLIEDARMLKLREEQQKKLQREQQAAQQAQQQSQKQQALSLIHNGGGSNESGSKSNAGDSRGSNSRLLKGPTDKQIETRMSDGRRRITPLYIPPPMDVDGAPIPFTVQQTTFSSSSEAKTKIVVEKRDESSSSSLTTTPQKQSSPNSKVICNNSQNSNQTPQNFQNSQAQISSTQTPSSNLTSAINDVVKDANASHSTSPVKSDQAENLASSSPPHVTDSNVNNTPSTFLNEKKGEKRSAPNSGNSLIKKIKPSSSVKVLKNVDGKAVNGTTNLVPKKKLEKSSEKDSARKKMGNKSSHKNSVVQSTNNEAANVVADRGHKNDDKQEKVISKATEGRTSIVQFPSLKIEKSASINIKLSGSASFEHSGLVVEVENNMNNTPLSCLRVLSNDNEKIWEAVISSKICGLAGGEYLIAIACEDCTLSVFCSSTGRRLHTPLLINSLAAKLTCVRHYLLVISSKASLWLWNFDKHHVVIKNESLIPLFNSHGNSIPASDISLVSTTVTDSGAPMISLSTGKTFVFDTAFGSWSLISNTQDILNFHSDYKPTISSNPSAFPLAILQSHHRLMKSSHYLFQNNPSLQKTGTLSFIDQQLASSFVIGSSREYRHWLITLAQFLAEEGIESRLRELCQYLLGPPFQGPDSKWERTILGNKKHELLQEILAITTCNLKLQRFYTEFKQQLDLISSTDISTSPNSSQPFASSCEK